jgi:hypothetical protein
MYGNKKKPGDGKMYAGGSSSFDEKTGMRKPGAPAPSGPGVKPGGPSGPVKSGKGPATPRMPAKMAPKPQVPAVVQAMKEKMAMKAKKGK